MSNNVLTTFTDISNAINADVSQAQLTNSRGYNIIRNSTFDRIKPGQQANMWCWEVSGPASNWTGNQMANSMQLQPTSPENNGACCIYQDIPISSIPFLGITTQNVEFAFSFSAIVQSSVKAAYVDIELWSESINPNTNGTMMCKDGWTNLQSGPGWAGYKCIGSLQNGAAITVLKEENGWVEIKYQNGTAWMPSDRAIVSVNDITATKVSTSQLYYSTPHDELTPFSTNWTFTPGSYSQAPTFIRILFGITGLTTITDTSSTVFPNTQLNNGSFWFMCPKLEIGQIPTAYAPNPNDIPEGVQTENLLPDSGTYYSGTWQAGGNHYASVYPDGDGGQMQQITGSWSYITPIIDRDKFVIGETYTFSCEIKIMNGDKSPDLLVCRSVTNTTIGETLFAANCIHPNGYGEYVNGIAIPDPNSGWIKIYTTFVLDSYIGGPENFQTQGQYGIRFEFNNVNQGTTIFLRRHQLVKGRQLIDWKPSPLDREEYITLYDNSQANTPGGGPMYYQKVNPGARFQEFSGFIYTNWCNREKLEIVFPMAFSDTAYDMQLTAFGANTGYYESGSLVYGKEQGKAYICTSNAAIGYLWKASGYNALLVPGNA